jgi:hypothetical protein
MPDEILADITQKESIEATRLALEFLLTHSEPCEGDLDRLKRLNMAAYLIVIGLLEGEKVTNG